MSVSLRRQLRKVGQFASRANVRPRRVEQSVIEKQRDDLRCAHVNAAVLTASGSDKVLRSVVVLHAVDVVNDDGVRQPHAARRLVDVAVLHNVAVSVRRFMFGLVQKDIALPCCASSAFPRSVFCATFRQHRACVMSVAPASRIANVLAALWSGVRRDACRFTAAALAQTRRCNPSMRRLKARAGLCQASHFDSQSGVVSEVVQLDIARRPSRVSGSPRNDLVAATLAAIDRGVTWSGVTAPVTRRELRLDAGIARGVAQQVPRVLVTVPRLVGDWLFAAALTPMTVGYHLSMIHLNNATGG